MKLTRGAHLGHYTILSPIGAGGMGEVYLAEDARLHRQVALKLLPTEFTQDADRVRRFSQEAKAVSSLDHPNIITIHEIDQAEAGPFIVMELVTGQTLRALDKPCIIETVIHLGREVARALAATHAAGIIHRDIKPENIMVRDDGYVKVVDFGLARLNPLTNSVPETATLSLKTMPGVLLGTVAYMSPEQTRAEHVTPATDIFALGIVLYELATGHHPFKTDSVIDTMNAIGSKSAQPPSLLNPGIPAVLDVLIQRMLEKEAVLRPTANEVDHILAEAHVMAGRGQQQRGNYGWSTEGLDSADSKDSEASPVELQRQNGDTSSPIVREGLPSDPYATRADARVTDSASHTPSIAVLPFVNISNDPDNEYFCEGLAEELLNALSKMENLNVAARTSAFSFKGKDTDIREIGHKLNVETVLEGSVRKSGNRLRITAQLINVSDGYHLWSERYDRELEDIFDIQDEISLAIVGALKVKLLGAQKTAVLKRYTDNSEAYQLYLKGRYYYGKWGEGWGNATHYFEQAIGREPNYAPAFAGLADCYFNLWWTFSKLSVVNSLQKAQEAAARALEIDSELPGGHLCLARLKFYHDWDFVGAEREYRQALTLNPNYAEAHEQFGSALGVMGRAAEAIAEGRRALELDPLSLLANLDVGWIFFCCGQYQPMREQGQKLIEMEPRFVGGHWLLGTEAWVQGRHDQAISEHQAAVALGAEPHILASLGCLYGIVGERDKAQQVLEELQKMSKRLYSLPYPIAMVHAGLGDKDSAFEMFEQAYQRHDGLMLYLRYFGPLIPEVKGDTRFSDLLGRIGSPE